MRKLSALLIAATLLCLPVGASAWWQSIQQVGVSGGGATVVCGSGWTGPTSGLTHCWPLDATHVSGTTIQDAIGSDSGTAGANVVAGTGPSGLSNSARTFDGTTQPILLASSPGVSSPLSVFFWINKVNDTTNDASDQRWVCFDGTPVILVVNPSSIGNAGGINPIISGAFDESSAASTVSSGSWHHIGFTYNGVTTVVYLDGSVVTMSGGSSGDGCTAGVSAIGGRDSTQRLWAGSMATVVTYSRALSGSEVTQLFNAF